MGGPGRLDPDDIEEAAWLGIRARQIPGQRSSIAVLAEFDGRKAVLTGDAHAD
jgi:hypothetical protein